MNNNISELSSIISICIYMYIYIMSYKYIISYIYISYFILLHSFLFVITVKGVVNGAEVKTIPKGTGPTGTQNPNSFIKLGSLSSLGLVIRSSA